MIEHFNYYGRMYLFLWEICIWGWVGESIGLGGNSFIGLLFLCWPNMHVVVCDLMDL